VRGQADESEKIELSLQQRQVAILAAFALVLLGVVFALGVMVGRQLASASLAAPAQPPPGDLRALDAEKPPPKPVVAPAPIVAANPVDEDADAAVAEAKIAPDRAQPAPAVVVAAKPIASPKPLAEKVVAEKAVAEKPAAEKQVAEVAPNPAPPSPEELTKEDADDEQAPAPKAAIAAKPAPVKESEAPADPPDAQPKHLGKFTVQFGATQEHKDALKIAARAKAQGLQAPYIVTAHIEGKGTWYRLRAGAFESRDDAAAYSKTVDASLKGVHSAVMTTN
jgi:DedD protein